MPALTPVGMVSVDLIGRHDTMGHLSRAGTYLRQVQLSDSSRLVE